MNKALITGIGGFLGFHIAKLLLNKGFHVVGVDNFSNSKRDLAFEKLLQEPNFQFVFIDLLDLEQLDLIPKDFQIVIHMAAINGTENFYERPLDVLKSCIQSTLNLITYCEPNTHLQKFVLASTSENYAGGYGKPGFKLPTPENVPLVIEEIENVRWSYAAGKIASEAALVAFAKKTRVEFVILRLHNIYGPRMGTKHLIPEHIKRLHNGQHWIFGAEQTRSFLYVDDAAEAIGNLLEPGIHGIFNIGSSEEVSVENIAKEISAILKDSHPLKRLPAPPGSVERRVPDTEKYKKLFGEIQRINLKEGLAKTVRWYQEEGF